MESKLQLHFGNGKSKRREHDFYPTPKEVTVALMEFLKFPKLRIWECACGSFDMSKVLESYGHYVISTDIQSGVDFLKTTKDCDAIITNPPFNLSHEFIEKALKEADIVAMVLKSQYWHAKKRYDLFMENKPAYILPMTWRPNFAGKGSPIMEVNWTVWIKGDERCRYIPLKKPQ